MITRSSFPRRGHDLTVRGITLLGPYVRGGWLRASSTLIGVVYGLLNTCVAFASGSLPPVPITADPFRNFAECLNYLESTSRREASMAMPRRVKSLDGGAHQTILSSAGVVRGTAEQTTYNSEIGHVNRAIDVRFHSIVTSYDWERYTLTRQSAVLSGVRQSSYASQGIEVIPPGQSFGVPSK